MSVLRTSIARSVRPTVAAGAGARASAVRFSSTASDALSSASASASTQPTGLPMTWSEYFQMRRRRKIWANATSVPTSIGGLLLGASYFANLNLEGDAGQTIMGIDPMFVYGGSTLACMLGGWLVGPTIGNVLFSATHPKLARGNPPPLEVMDREFYHRIKDRRADPSRQSVTNPAPDFYGEKIVSIPTYRRWLKDQKAYDRKASHGVPGEEE